MLNDSLQWDTRRFVCKRDRFLVCRGGLAWAYFVSKLDIHRSIAMNLDFVW